MDKSTQKLAGMIIVCTIGLPILLVVLLIKGLLWVIAYFVSIKRKNDELKIYNDILNINLQEQLSKVDMLEGIEFEKYIGQMLKKIGFTNVVITKGSGDFGADIIAEKENERYAFQCKRFSTAIGPKPIGEVLRGMNKYNCTKGIVVTNNYFTKQAIEEAEVSAIELWDREKLSSLINEINNIEETAKVKLLDDNIKKGDRNMLSIEKIPEMEDDIQENTMYGPVQTTVTIDKVISKNIGKIVELTAGFYEIDEDLEEGKYKISAKKGTRKFIC